MKAKQIMGQSDDNLFSCEQLTNKTLLHFIVAAAAVICKWLTTQITIIVYSLWKSLGYTFEGCAGIFCFCGPSTCYNT